MVAGSSSSIQAGIRHPARSSDHTECDDPRGRFKTVGNGSLYEFHIEAAATRQHGIQDDIECCPHHFMGNVDLGPWTEAEPTISRTLRASEHGRQEITNRLLLKNGATARRCQRHLV